MVRRASFGLAILFWIPFAAILAQAAGTFQSTYYPTTPTLAYWPPIWPVDQKDGWNWTTSFAPYDPEPFAPANQTKDSIFLPCTSRVGAHVTGLYLGWSVSLYAWTRNGTRVTVSLDDVSKSIQASADGVALIDVDLPQQENRWFKLNITLEDGELQVLNLTTVTTETSPPVPLGDRYLGAKKVLPVSGDGQHISAFYNVSGEGAWSPQTNWQYEGVSERLPHLLGEPGASLTFRTWPNTTSLDVLTMTWYGAGLATFDIEPRPSFMPTPGDRNLSSPLAASQALARVVLDPRERYTVTVRNTDPVKQLRFVGGDFTLTNREGANWDWRTDGANGSNTNVRKTNVGAIVGGVVGGVGGALLLAALLWCYCRRRRDDDESIVDDTDMAWETQSSHSYLPQEIDAGPLNLRTVPPSYDPAWVTGSSPSSPCQPAGYASFPLSPVEPPIPAVDHRYLQAKREHSALFSPVARYFRQQWSDPKGVLPAQEGGKRDPADATGDKAKLSPLTIDTQLRKNE